MAGDYSRKVFNPEKHYHGVLMQQGRVQLDADWNEQLDIQQYRTETQTTDVVGVSGVPKLDGGFKINISTTGTRLTISPGRLYVAGFLCELSQEATYFEQPHYPAPDFAYFNNQPSSPPTSPPDANLLTLQDGTYVVYLDTWQREINFRDDPHLHEVALGEADTTTRVQTVWQVKLLKVATTGLPVVGCQTTFPEWDQLIAPVTGQLNVQTKRTTDRKDPCALPPTTGFRRLENQLYRIEVQRGGTRTTSTFKWSRDNASVETRIEAIDGANLTVSDLGRDTMLGFDSGQWVEVVDETSTLTSQPNALFQITALNPGTQKITLNSSANALRNNANLKLRRWDQAGAEVVMDQAGALGGWLDLEEGIQVAFSDGSYHPGDYWTFAARTATGEVEWPPFAVPNLTPIPQPPAGARHHYCRLALVEIQTGTSKLHDCRKPFPPLTEITAADVLFDNTTCQFDPAIQTVQEALDALCHNGESICTLTAKPGPGWEAIFDKIKDGQDAQICFQVGDYLLQKPTTIKSKGNLKLNGSGLGTRILAPGLEAGLVFESCTSVLICDLYAETSLNRTPDLAAGQRLNGTLTFFNCPVVDVERVGLKCGTGSIRTAACLTVWNSDKSPGAARVYNCDLQIGHQQQGILLVNASTALVEHNTLRVYERTSQPGINDPLADQPHRAAAAQGITVGGRLALDVRVLNNTVEGALQGVLVGLSPERDQGGLDQAETVTVAGNTIRVVLPVSAREQDRHGIFVGHCKSLLIENNNIRLERLPGADAFPIDGIRVWGQLGDRLMITKNYVASADGERRRSFMVGIRVTPLTDKPETAQWVVMWNVAPSTQATVIVQSGAVDLPGTNAPS